MKIASVIIRILFFALFVSVLLLGKMFLWLAFFAASLIAAIFFGRLYCGYACPMNTLMGPIESVSKKLKLQRTSVSKWLRGGIFPWVFLAISIAVTLIAKKVFGVNLPILPFWLLASVLVTLFYKQAVFHNFICPFGGAQKIFGRAFILSKKVDTAACIGCKKCESVCPSEAIRVGAENKKAAISPPLCFLCTNCADVCPVSAIKYKSK